MAVVGAHRHALRDQAHGSLNGPLRIRSCEVVGFRRGITPAGAVNSQTFERITLRGPREVGLRNEGQTSSTRGRRSETLGGGSYTTTVGAPAPMFVNDASAVDAFLAEARNNGDPLALLASETRDTESRTVSPEADDPGTTVHGAPCRGPTSMNQRNTPR